LRRFLKANWIITTARDFLKRKDGSLSFMAPMATEHWP
jgi:hypothetical protein